MAKKIMMLIVTIAAMVVCVGCGEPKKEVDTNDGFVTINESFKEITFTENIETENVITEDVIT